MISARIFLVSILTGILFIFVIFNHKKKASAEVETLYIVMHNSTGPILRLFGNLVATTSLCESMS